MKGLPGVSGAAAPRRERHAVARTEAVDPLVAVAARVFGHELDGHTRVVDLMSRRALLVAVRQLLHEHVDRCTKCGSTFVTHEPAFVHCHYCGRMHRIANASLLEQELFELRMGLRLAS